MFKHTSLYDWHKKAGAKFTEFAGWEMPIQYTAIVQEHLAVRNSLGIFDISHMGQIFVEGNGSLSFLQKICTNDISKCIDRQAIYSHICNENGGVIDDIFIYRLSQNNYLVIVNAATSDKDFNWMLKHKNSSVDIKNRSDQFGMIALQGPLSEKVALKTFGKVPIRHHLLSQSFASETIWICQTGYTGEYGFEVIASNHLIPQIWDTFFEFSKECVVPITPCGLGARDTLRLEMGYLLYGQDVDEEHTPLEAALPWVVKFAKDEFIGKEALLQQQESGLKRKLAAFKLLQRSVPRHGSKILFNGKEVGFVTSGTFSPSLQLGIAMGYVPSDLVENSLGENGNFSIECHSRAVPASITKLPFYKKPLT